MPKRKIQECTTSKKKNKVKVPAKTSAERSREYRARKKALRYGIDLHLLSSTSIFVKADGNQEKPPIFVPKTPAQCSRDYRARKKALKNATDQDLRNSMSIIVKEEVHQEKSLTVRKTAAQCSRDYRARKKAIKNANEQELRNCAAINVKAEARRKAPKHVTDQDSIDSTSMIIYPIIYGLLNRNNKFNVK